MTRNGRSGGNSCRRQWRLWPIADVLRCLFPALLIVLTACQAPESPLRVATIQWVGYQPLHLAENQGYFDDLPVRLADFKSNVESLRAFRNGDVEVAALTLDEVLLLNAEGHDARVILVLDYSQGADAIVARPDIPDLAMLKGKRVGVESTAAGAYLLARALEFAGLDSADVNIVKLGIETQEQAYRDGAVDAFATFEPMRTRLLKLGARELFNSTQMPGEIVDVLAARGDTIEQRPEAIAALMRGWFRALEYAANQPDAAARQVAPHLGLTEEDYLRAVTGMRFPSLAENCALLDGAALQMRDTLLRLHGVMLKTGLLHTPEPAGDILDPRLLKRLGCTGGTVANG